MHEAGRVAALLAPQRTEGKIFIDVFVGHLTNTDVAVSEDSMVKAAINNPFPNATPFIFFFSNL